jgi:putative addiction module component (TIGR02574 family)
MSADAEAVQDIISLMMQKARELLKKALALPDKERADLAGSLIDSLDQTVDEDAEAAWHSEILRRLKKFSPETRTPFPGSTSARKRASS